MNKKHHMMIWAQISSRPNQPPEKSPQNGGLDREIPRLRFLKAGLGIRASIAQIVVDFFCFFFPKGMEQVQHLS